jgi:hypothetical protein
MTILLPALAALNGSSALAASDGGVDDTFTTRPGQWVSMDVLANDDAPPASSSPWGAVTDYPESGDLSTFNDIFNNGEFDGDFGTGKDSPVYSPDDGFSGVDTFAYEATDANGVQYTANVTIHVRYPFAPACTDPAVYTSTTGGETAPVTYLNADGTASTVVQADTATATIPIGVRQVTLDVCGAQGDGSAGNGGPGGRTHAVIANDENAARNLFVEAGTQDGRVGHGGAAGPNGYSGGGYSAVFDVANENAPVAVAGGGGGDTQEDCLLLAAVVPPGAGGGETGEDGAGICAATGGGGGTQTAGGAGGTPDGQAGSAFQGGAGGVPDGGDGGSGGGGGFFGGGGGGSGGGGGGGGSGYVNPSYDPTGTTTSGVNSLQGFVVVTYARPAAPVFVTDPSLVAEVAHPYSSNVVVTASPPAVLTFTGSLPPGLSFNAPNGTNAATISGTPTSAGTFPITVTATNAVGSASRDYSIVVASNPGGGTTIVFVPVSASPASSSTASPTPTGTRLQALVLSTSTPDITPGQQGKLHVIGQPGQDVQLFCYSRPSSTYVQARPAEIGQGVAITNSGALDFVILPRTNTRCVAQYLNDATSRSNSVVTNVHTTLSLSAFRDGVRAYHFQGSNLPRSSGQLVTLYRYATARNGLCTPGSAGCTALRSGVAVTDADGVWRIDRTFRASGQWVFVARTSETLNNAAGQSNFRQTIVH